MKTHQTITSTILYCFFGLFLLLDHGRAQLDITDEELAIPPTGEVQRLWLRQAASLKVDLTSALAGVPPGSEGQGSVTFAKFQTFNTGLATAISSRLQSNVFSLIPQYEELVPVYGGDPNAPALANELGKMITCRLPMLFINAMERRIIDQSGVVPSVEVEKFATVWTAAGAIGEGDGVQPTMDSAGIMILNPAAVVTKLESLPVNRAQSFMRKLTAVDAFARYETGGDGMLELKTKYAANKTEVIAKWNELALWVSQHTP